MIHFSICSRAWKIGLGVLLALASFAEAGAQKKVSCPDGEHIEIDVRRISIQYDASSFAGTLGSLSALGARMEVAPKRLQEVAAATQQWDEFLKGLAAGFNTCAITRQQYADGLTRIYPRLKEDGAGLDEVRKAIAAGQKIDAQRLQRLLDSFAANLRQFAQLSGKEIILKKMSALSDQVARSRADTLEQQKSDTERILAKFDELEKANQQTPLPTPAQVEQQISQVRKSLLSEADDAEIAYNKGYTLLNQYRFAEAIPYLQKAIADVPLPVFYLALGSAYYNLLSLGAAEKTIREGLQNVAFKDDKNKAQLTTGLGLILKAKGDLDGALKYAQQALLLDEKVYMPDPSDVERDANNVGQILMDKGDLDGALKYAQRALEIDGKLDSRDHPDLAILYNNVSLILKAKGDLDGALQYARRALDICEKVHGQNHPKVASVANNIGMILMDKGDLDEALQYAKRALNIYEKVYGPDHPQVATAANNIGRILDEKGNLDEALQYTERALRIDEKVYSPDNPKLATEANNLGMILQDKGNLDGALQYADRALKIDENAYGPNHPTVARDANNIGMILEEKGDLEGALRYTQRALKIDQQAYGPDHPTTKMFAENVEEIRRLKRK